MTHVDQGIYGAKRQSMEDVSPRALLKQVMIDMPRATREEVWEEFNSRVDRSKKNYDKPMRKYWFGNNYQSMLHKPRTKIKKADVESAKITLGGKMRQFVLLDMVLAHGKKLRDSTGKECAVLGTKTQAWLSKIAEKIGPRAVVGDVLSEEDVRALWR